MPGSFEWGQVTARADKVLIVATGPSMARFPVELINPLEGVHVIAVKSAIEYLPAQTWVSADLNQKCYQLLKRRRHGCEYIAIVPYDYGTEKARVGYHRVTPPTEITYIRRRVIRYSPPEDQRLSEEPGILCTGNSAFGALGVAYLMGAKKIAMIGVDATRDGYGLGPGRPFSSLEHVPSLFANVKGQLDSSGVEVVNGSQISKVKCFRQCTPEDAVAWIKGTD